MTRVELRTTAMAVGGEAVAREASGRVVFVAGALPHETVLVELADERRSFARGRVVDVVSASPDRVEPPCPHVAEGCGGCDWQHVEEEAQRRLRLQIVREVLERQAGLVDPSVQAGPPLPAASMRTTVRGVADDEGRLALRRRRSHELVPAEGCLVAHPRLRELVDRERFPPGVEVTLRVGARTGEHTVLLGDEPAPGSPRWLHEEAAGRRWRVSARSFFQASPEGAEALVDSVQAFVDAHALGAERMVDLCSGVGLFAGTVGAGRRVVAVERSAAAVADARVNLADLDVRIIKVALARWRWSPADLVVADPARSGLGKEGVAAVAGTGAGLCVLISCDPAALGRDAALLAEAGYRHVGSTVLDLFGHSSHIEVVSGFMFRG